MSESSAVVAALEANRALVAQLRDVVSTLTNEERRLRSKVLEIRHRMALRRAQKAIDELAPRHGQQLQQQVDSDGDSDADIFVKKPESRYKPVSEIPRSYIRPKRSFFSDAAGASGAQPPRKRGRKPRGYKEQFLQQKQNFHVLSREDPTEPPPNEDTLFLRQHSHEAFIAVPAKVFNPKEREIVKEFGEAQLKLLAVSATSDNQDQKIPLETWNLITTRTKPPIHRSGFACMLRWELHDKPGLRLCAWTKDEDKALRTLASGEVDPTIVNHWDEIAKRMPFPGRPPVHCLIRYQTKLCATNMNTVFTPEEDALILQAVSVFGERWNIIADLMDGRVPEQLRHRWQLSLSPQVKHGKFSMIEDRRMLLALYAYHDKQTPFRKETIPWTDVCHHTPGRLQPALRDRFLNSLNSEISLTSWKKEDDEKLLRLVAELGWNYPGLWSRIAAELGNRSDSQVSRRWRFLAPEEYEKYMKEKREAGAASLPGIFQRPILARQRVRAVNYSAKRSSYNVNDAPEQLSDNENGGEGEPDVAAASVAVRSASERAVAQTQGFFGGVVI